ncbi:hypothetical protein CV102_02680 [Natronococcus pandeyae]|uniref:ArsR family transcriptional regulator n=1 Tax=Natronococcus pandeyae TaxID=2055836 RepID=A0A8J8Q7U0_9EURY|nr:hypothetical protein [Natronococcus pandeyae]TYL40727.1 hypothetical protein CV102_02680 [Natronococcus pandeyae]
MIAHSSDQHHQGEVVEDDDVFDALADGQRRQLLVDLLDSDLQRVSDLSDTSRELIEAHDALLDQVLSGQLEIPGADTELIQKHRVHLPKLAKYGFIEWNPEDCLVARGPRFDELTPVLEQMENQRTDHPVTDPFTDFRE